MTDLTHQPPLRVQVAIIGAGPTGLTLANLLGAAGIHAVLIERNEGLSGIPKALMVDDEFFRLLHKLGLAGALAAHGVGPVSYDYISPLGFRVTHNKGQITANGFPSRTATFQPAFEEILLGGAARYPEVSVLFGTELLGFSDQGGGVTLEVQTTAGERRRVRADYLLAADGSHSLCRKTLGIEFEELVPFGQRHVVVDVVDDPDRSQTARIHMGWQRTFSSLPAPNGGRRYEFSLRPEEDAETMLSDEVLTRVFAPHRPYRDLNIIRKVVYTFHSRLAKRLEQGRVFLLGDAAHVMPVFGSQGMNSGARDANNLSWKLILVLKGAADPKLLASYHDERHSQVAETIRIATTNGKLQSSRNPVLSTLRDGGFALLSLVPRIRRYFADMRYIPKPFLQTGIVVHDPLRSEPGAVGRLLPGATISLGERTALIDDFLGPGWALIGVNLPGAAPPDIAPAAEYFLGPAVIRIESGEGTKVDPRLDDVFAAHSGEWLIIRPDRIVAAAARPEALRTVTRNLAQQLGLADPAMSTAAE